MVVRADVKPEIIRRIVREKLAQSIPDAIVACVVPYLIAAIALHTLLTESGSELAGLVLLLAPSIYATACVVLASRISATSSGRVLIAVALTALVIPAALTSLIIGLVVLAPVVFGMFCGLIVAPCWKTDRSVSLGGLYGSGVWILGLILVPAATVNVSQTISAVMFWLFVGFVFGAPPLICVRLALLHHADTTITAWTNVLCIHCGYPLDGLTNNICPECGELITDPQSPPPRA